MSRKTVTIHNAMLPEHYEQMQADMAELAGSLPALAAALGAYYTPPEVLALVDPVEPASGSGSYLVEIVWNPPYAS